MISKVFQKYPVRSFLAGKRRLLVVFFFLSALLSNAQTYDTISNWDGIVQDWYFSAGSGKTVLNPAPDEVNASTHCLQVTTTNDIYDFFSYELPVPANFDAYPRYRLKVLAPPTGGNILLKFENQDYSYFHEISATPISGKWTDITFDFSGLYYDNLVRMVIFYDFLGTTPNKTWYFDDILKEIPEPVVFESNLPIVVINTFGVPIPDEPKISATMGIIDNGPGAVNHSSDPFNGYDGPIGIEVRGQSTQMFPKKSYAFETRDSQGENFNVSILGMPKENDWILYAPYSDKSLMRNVVTFEINRRTGHYGTRTKYCELILNGDYKGIYVMEEKIKRDKNRVNIANLKPSDISGDALTGGYILRVDKLDPDFEFDYDGWISYPEPQYPNAKNIIFQYYRPKPDELMPQQKAYIKDYVDAASGALASAGFTDPEQGYQQYFDVRSFVDFMLVNEIAKEVDNYRYSNYLYKKRDSDGGKLFAGPVWDFNLGYGNVDFWPEGIQINGWHYEMVFPVEWSIMFWWKRLMEDPYFAGFAHARWKYLRQEKLTNSALQAVIDSLVAHTAQARERNFQRWKILGEYVWPNHYWQGNDYDDEVNYFRTFLFNRMNWMDNNFAVEVIEPTAKISADANVIELKLVDDYFANAFLAKEAFVLNNAPEGASLQSVEYVSASECKLILNMNVEQAGQISVTVSSQVLNSWSDLTSHTLSADGLNGKVAAGEIRVRITESGLQLGCIRPELLGTTARIYSSDGRLVKQFQLLKQPLQQLPFNETAGIYLLQLDYANEVVNRKIVKAG